MRKDIYVVGYPEKKNVVYGKYHCDVAGNEKRLPNEDFAQPMTENQAKCALIKMPCKGAVIYKLVPITFND